MNWKHTGIAATQLPKELVERLFLVAIRHAPKGVRV